MTSPWLSVILPTCDGMAYISQALDSIAIQRDPDIEVIAIDDGSTDGTIGVLRRSQSTLRLRIIECERLGNWVANSDRAVRQATGEYVCFLHQDDFWYPGRLAEMRACVERAPATALWLHPVWYVDAHGRRLGRWTCPLPTRGSGLSADLVLEHLLVQNFIGMPAPVFRRDVYLATAGMDAQLWYLADWDLWLSLAERGTTAYLPRPLAAFRIHAQSQTVRRGRDLDDLRDQYQRVFERHFAAWTCRDERVRAQVRAAFEASTDVTHWLMGRVQGQPAQHVRLLNTLTRLGPGAWWRLGRDSRLGERLMPRVKLRWRGGF